MHVFHGGARSKMYELWAGMIGRCRQSSPSRARYFDRGIRVCEQWLEFTTFAADMGERPSPAHSIDRIDNDGNYEPRNCRWATATEQGANTRKTVLVTALGTTLPLRGWSRVTGLAHRTISARLRAGVHPDDAVLTPGRE